MAVAPRWEPYAGEYEKRHYNIQLKNNGRVLIECWPNANWFYCLSTGEKVHGSDVGFIQICPHWSDDEGE